MWKNWWFKTGKGIGQGCILSPCLFNFYAEYIMQNAGLDDSYAGIKTAVRNTNNLRYPDDNKKLALKLNTQKIKIMGSSVITLWQIDGETMETVSDFIFLGSKITADGDCSNEIKRHLLGGKKAMTNLDSILKSRDITLPKRSVLSKLWFFQ